jgi:hypothetical protein
MTVTFFMYRYMHGHGSCTPLAQIPGNLRIQE